MMQLKTRKFSLAELPQKSTRVETFSLEAVDQKVLVYEKSEETQKVNEIKMTAMPFVIILSDQWPVFEAEDVRGRSLCFEFTHINANSVNWLNASSKCFKNKYAMKSATHIQARTSLQKQEERTTTVSSTTK